jgi:hypothetical protein
MHTLGVGLPLLNRFHVAVTKRLTEVIRQMDPWLLAFLFALCRRTAFQLTLVAMRRKLF